jgi:hypothetical protein
VQQFSCNVSGKFESPTFQLAQASLLMGELDRLRSNQPNLPIVLCGDLNSSRKSLVREYLLHGMPNVEVESGEPRLLISQDGKFSAVWQEEFNRKFDKEQYYSNGEKIWEEDCFPWQQLWYIDGPDDRSLLPRRSPNVPLADAFQEFHEDPLAFTNPGDQLIIDHMYAHV